MHTSARLKVAQYSEAISARLTIQSLTRLKVKAQQGQKPPGR